MKQAEAIQFVYDKGFKFTDNHEPTMLVTDVFKLIQLIYNDFDQPKKDKRPKPSEQNPPMNEAMDLLA